MWLSVQSARELYTHQIAVERQEFADIPQEELALIYQAWGLDPETAGKMAERIIAREIPDGSHAAALDMLAREELGIDPQELGGSAWQASITSFLLFAAGAIVPVIPFAFGSGWMAVLVSLLVGLSRRTRCPGKLSSSFDLSTAKLPGNSDVPVIHYPENATVL